MTPTEIRAELLEQHREIRAKVQQALELVRQGAMLDAQLRATAAELTEALATHNTREETVLGELLPRVDETGVLRKRLMEDEHAAEHVALRTALTEAMGLYQSTSAASMLQRTLEALLEHMDREESTFLAEASFGAADFMLDQFGG